MTIFNMRVLQSGAAVALAGLAALTQATNITDSNMDMSGYLQSLQLGNASLQSLSDTFSVVPFDQDFPSSPTAWNISIDRRFINMTRLKVATTRYHNSIDEPAWTEGPPRNNMSRLRDYWLNEYNWDDVEAKLNTQYNHFVTTVNLPYSNYSDPVKLHFVHHKSNRSDAIPLLFMHGTPGNFMEVYNILEPLINPPADQPAFHVVAPSMPGYGFSPAPRIPGMDPTIASGAMNQMMLQLGYDRYVVQGGDYGSIVLRYITGLYPQHVVSALANFFLVQPNATDLARYAANQTTPDETTYIKSIQNFGNSASGYRMLMALHPLQAVIAMTDSPIGNMAFGWDMMYYLSDPTYPWTLEEIITWGMMYWIPGPYAAWRHYREMSLHGVLAGPTLGNNYPFINQNIGITEFPGDFWYRLPLEWAQRYSNANWRTVHTTGAHFPSLQNTNALVEDMRYYFGNASLSGTSEWRNASQAQPYQFVP